MADVNDGRIDLHRSRGRFIAFGVVVAWSYEGLVRPKRAELRERDIAARSRE